MGMTSVRVSLKNLQVPEKETEGEFLVDSGAQFTVVPAPMVRQLGLEPKRQGRFALADGKVIYRQMGSCLVRYGKLEVPTQVVLGERDDGALLGMITLEEMGLMLDPLSRKLKKMTLRM